MLCTVRLDSFNQSASPCLRQCKLFLRDILLCIFTQLSNSIVNSRLRSSRASLDKASRLEAHLLLDARFESHHGDNGARMPILFRPCLEETLSKRRVPGYSPFDALLLHPWLETTLVSKQVMAPDHHQIEKKNLRLTAIRKGLAFSADSSSINTQTSDCPHPMAPDQSARARFVATIYAVCGVWHTIMDGHKLSTGINRVLAGTRINHWETLA